MTTVKYSTILVFLIFICNGSILFGQVTIGSNEPPQKNAVLELKSGDKGLLLPRLALTSTSSSSPMDAHIQGMLIYNTASSNDVTPGCYFNNGEKWVRLSSATLNGDGWSITGNSVDAQTHFLGTTNDEDLVIKTNSAEGARLTKEGKLGINTATPNSTLHVNGSISANIRARGDGETISDDDYTVIISGTVTLPNPSSANIGKIYVLVAANPGSHLRTTSFRDSIGVGTEFNFSSDNGGRSLTVQSDGTYWWILSRN